MVCKSNVILRPWCLARPLFMGLLAFFCTAAGMPARAADGAPLPCADAAYEQFDFWLGSWIVHGADGTHSGENRIEKSADGCRLDEHWTSSQGGGGFSINFYDPTLERWQQLWVSANGVIDIEGGLVDGSMVLEGEIRYRSNGASNGFRGTWTELEDGRVRQFFEQQVDGEWQPWFEGFYTKVVE